MKTDKKLKALFKVIFYVSISFIFLQMWNRFCKQTKIVLINLKSGTFQTTRCTNVAHWKLMLIDLTLMVILILMNCFTAHRLFVNGCRLHDLNDFRWL